MWNIFEDNNKDIRTTPKEYTIRTGVLAKRVNRGAGYGLEIPVCFIFQGHVKEKAWVKNKIKDAEKMI